MNISEMIKSLTSRDFLKIIAVHLMLGLFMGYLFFYNVFYYFSAPFDSPISAWVLLLSFSIIGVLIGYLFPDPRIVMASSVTLPMTGAFFCFLIFISPTFSTEIISSNLSDDLFILARLILVNLILSFLVIFVTSFISLYFFDAEYDDDDPFTDTDN